MADNPTYRHIGKNFTPPDIEAKVTGASTYSEDFRAEGMAYIKMLLSPMPKCIVRNIDASEALAMEGVYGIMTADDVPTFPNPGEQILSNEPNFIGEPILAIAAVDEATAANALELVRVEYEEQDFVLDPLESLYPGGTDAYYGGNLVSSLRIEEEDELGDIGVTSHKWTARDFAAVEEGQLPMGEPIMDWQYGDLDAAFNDAALVLDETFVTACNSHHSMEPRSAFSYWQNGKCYVHGSTQSQMFVVPGLANFIGIPPSDLVYISEFCGGGFGSKGAAYAVMALPAHFSRMIGRPCMLRISRAEEYYLGSARASFQGRAKLAFNAQGKMTGVDLFIVQQGGAKNPFGDFGAAGGMVSLVYTPDSMRFRAIPIGTNTTPCGPQRGPGQNQMSAAIEPLLDKAANALGIDQLEIRRINASNHETLTGGPVRQKVSSSYMLDAIDMAAERFDWTNKFARNGERNGSKVIGVGIGQGYHSAGISGFDGLMRILPDGKLHIHTGVGNLGTYSYASTCRVAAEVLNMDWDNCVIERGDTSKHLPWTIGQFGSLTTYTMSRANYAAAMDMKQKLQEIAAMDLGGNAEDYDLANETVFNINDPSMSITYAQAAQRALELGGKYAGEDPNETNPLTQASVAGLAGTGLIGVARDTTPLNEHISAMVATFVMIELDLETGKYDILEFVSSGDCGTVNHPLGLVGQLRGGACMGIGMARTERQIYDPQNGLPGSVGLYQAKPPSYLDVPAFMDVSAVDKPDPTNPMGMKGIGEPPVGAAVGAVLAAVSNALGGHYFNRNPVTPDMIINAASGREQSHSPLQLFTQ